MIDREFIGMRLVPRTVAVEEGQLRFFAKAVGETDPIFVDADAARAAGHRALPAPPTFAFTLNQLAPAGADWMAEMGIPIGRVLHGEQGFEHLAPIYAGDTVTLNGAIVDIYEKRGGALEFVVMEIEAVNQDGLTCVRQRTVTVVRNS